MTTTRNYHELNLENVFATDICLIEWPQRLGNMVLLHRLEINLRLVVVEGKEEEEQPQPQLLQQQSSDSELDDDEAVSTTTSNLDTVRQRLGRQT